MLVQLLVLLTANRKAAGSILLAPARTCKHLRSKSADGGTQSVSLSLSFTLSLPLLSISLPFKYIQK